MSRNNSEACPGETGDSFKAALSWLRERGNAELIRRGLRGVEKESLRVQLNGELSARPHPASLGAALTHPYVTTDYSEALPEFVTPPHSSNWETLQFLCDLHAYVHRNLSAELLWPASMPCTLTSNDDIPIANYGTSNSGLLKTIYRRGLGFRYGKSMQAIAGVHFNYSLPSDFWMAYRARRNGDESLQDLKSAAFMGLVRNYRRCAWLVTYLFGASPAFSKSFRPEGHDLLVALDGSTWYAPYATSLRMSDLGYRNKTQAGLSIIANSLDEYVNGLASAVTTVEPRYQAIGVVVGGEYRQLNANILQIENEYYSAIRPKPSKASASRTTVALRTHGVEYVEVRTLDLNLTDPVGINQNQLRLLEALLIFCLLTDSPPIDAAEQEEIDRRDVLVARDGRRPGLTLSNGGRKVALFDWGTELLERVGEVAQLLDVDNEGYVAAVQLGRRALEDPNETPSAKLLRDLQQERASFFEYSLALARTHHEYFLALPLDPKKQRWLSEIAQRSRLEAEALERDRSQSFDDYLKDLFSTV
ncbi:MAG TPA: glutamate--cysteine ligase [Gammaproteobacteria bacterium]|nr:glutamate--cysteine ligase [Gammaproteobacteria bacterium]